MFKGSLERCYASYETDKCQGSSYWSNSVGLATSAPEVSEDLGDVGARHYSHKLRPPWPQVSITAQHPIKFPILFQISHTISSEDIIIKQAR